MNSHIIITGTGRAGTTFLIQLLTELNFNTGFKNKYHNYNHNVKAGMEIVYKNNNDDIPHIIKNPKFCDSLDDDIQNGLIVDHVIIPVRNLQYAANSRIKNQGKDKGLVSGGLFGTNNPTKQENVLALKLYNLIFTITKHDLNYTFLLYPKILKDPKYLYSKLLFLFNKITYNDYITIYDNVLNKNLITNN